MVSLQETRYVRSESGWEELLRRSVENWPVMGAGSVIGLIALTGQCYFDPSTSSRSCGCRRETRTALSSRYTECFAVNGSFAGFGARVPAAE